MASVDDLHQMVILKSPAPQHHSDSDLELLLGSLSNPSSEDEGLLSTHSHYSSKSNCRVDQFKHETYDFISPDNSHSQDYSTSSAPPAIRSSIANLLSDEDVDPAAEYQQLLEEVQQLRTENTRLAQENSRLSQRLQSAPVPVPSNSDDVLKSRLTRLIQRNKHERQKDKERIQDLIDKLSTFVPP
ncbi:hypothetical protein GEMRC1_008129 [Eukaryota sp. GEM-RC1]